MNAVSETDRLIPGFTLKSVPGIGNFLFKRLIEKFGSPRAVFEADHRELTALLHCCRPSAFCAAIRPSDQTDQVIHKLLY